MEHVTCELQVPSLSSTIRKSGPGGFDVISLPEGGSRGRAYLLKERVEDLDLLAGAIRAVAEGGSAIDSKVVEALVARTARTEESPLEQLTPRERIRRARRRRP